jgi:amino acid transporter
MAAYLPHKKGFAGYSTRFVDPALGFALGWNYLMKYIAGCNSAHTLDVDFPIRYLIVTPNNINAAGIVIQYWNQSINIAVWMGRNYLFRPRASF